MQSQILTMSLKILHDGRGISNGSLLLIVFAALSCSLLLTSQACSFLRAIAIDFSMPGTPFSLMCQIPSHHLISAKLQAS